MKKSTKILTIALCVAIGGAALVACDNNDKKPGGDGGDGGDKVTVTFYNATGTNKPSEMEVLKTVDIDKGGKVESYTPESYDGYEFVNWFATPSKSHKYDFTEAINEDIAIYGGFSKYVADTRDFYIIGAGKSNVLVDGWGVINDKHKFTKTEGKNEYKLTLDLMKGDQFTINSDKEYRNKHGAGYLTSSALTDGTVVFSGMGSVFDDSSKGKNIVVEYDGNYTLTLVTHPNEDVYNTAGEGYTEERKEIYATNPYDTISWVRNSDPVEEVQVVTDFYIKGAGITSWKDMYNASTKMTNAEGVYTLSVYLKKDEEFMFTSRNTAGSSVGVGSTNIRSTALDDASKAYVDETARKNMVAKAAGTYTFTYTAATEKLAVTFDASATPAAADYYIDGTFAEGVADWNGYNFNSTFKLVETEAGSGIYKIENVAMKADSQFIIQAFKAGSAERGEWGTPSYNGLGSYNYTYVLDEEKAFGPVGGGNNNIKVSTEGNYDITFNSYSKIITIAAHPAA